MNSKLLLPLLLVKTMMLTTTSCVKVYKEKTENGIVIPIDINKAIVLDIDDFSSDFVREIQYIPLETTNESLISSVRKVFLHKDNVIIFDERQNKILLFGQSGTFKKQLGTRGPGPDEYAMLNDVFFEETTGLIYAHERIKNIVFVYNLEGEIVDKIKPEFSFNSFCKTKDGFWLYTCFKNNNPDGFNLMLVDHSMQRMIGGYFPQNPNFINVQKMCRFRLDNEGIAYFTYPTSNNIYRLKGITPEVWFTIDFGRRTAPYKEIATIETSEEYDKLMENDFLMLGDYHIWNNMLLFNFSESSFNRMRTRYSGFYNMDNSVLNIYKGFINSLKIPTSTFVCTSGKALILSAFPFELEEKYLKYMEEQLNLKLDDDSNPVLMICYP